MRLRRTAAVLSLLLAAWLLPQGVSADEGCDRQCRIDAANLYLAALISHDGSDVPFHEDAWRKENGGYSGRSGEEIRQSLSSPIMWVTTGMRDLRWYGEEDSDDVVAIFLLDTATPAPTYIIERFRVIDGLIHEIEAHFHIDFTGYTLGPESPLTNPDGVEERLTASNHGPLGPVPVSDGNTGDDAPRPAATCADPDAEDTRVCVVDAVEAFLGAMASHDPSGVPLASDATYEVNRRAAAANADEVRTLLSDDANGITGLEPITLVVEGEAAVAHYVITLGDARSYGAARFRVADGLITEIEAVCSGSETCTAGGGGGAPGLPDPFDVTSTVVAGPGATFTGYATPAALVQAGEGASFNNADTMATHNVVSNAPGPHRGRLFSTPLIPGGQTVPIEGVEALAAGTYGFFCTLHTGMTGELIVQ